MSASPVSSTLAGNPILDGIDGGERWSGEISYNRVEPGNAAETQAFSSNLPSPYVTESKGLTDAMWTLVGQSLRLLQGYAGFSYALTNAGDANYLVSDFYKPDNQDAAGIAAEPGNGPILAFNVNHWNAYTAEQQSYIVLHELSHTLGLRHLNGLPAELNYAQYSLMSYDWYTLGNENAGTGLPLTPMALDVAVLQAKYGAAAANTGATSYLLGGGAADLDGGDGVIRCGIDYACIWDTAGTDTLAYDGGSAALLNLNAATLSTTALTGDLADLIGDVAATSRIFAGLSGPTQLEITDPKHTAGGFFSSLISGVSRLHSGFTIANGVTVEQARGGAGNDLIIGNEAANTLTGNGGADELFGGSGDDTLDGGAGDDRAFGGLGADSLVDGAGQNYLRGDEGNDTIIGGSGFDDINGNMGDDSASGGLGADWVVGGKDQDLLSGDDGDDIIYGNIGVDTCDGGAGNDIVRGGQDNDSLAGGKGDDWLSGDRGDDTITGGSGADFFHSFGDAGIDRVLDFNRTEGDKVLLDPGSTYTVAQLGPDVVITITGGAQITLVGVAQSDLTGDWIMVG